MRTSRSHYCKNHVLNTENVMFTIMGTNRKGSENARSGHHARHRRQCDRATGAGRRIRAGRPDRRQSVRGTRPAAHAHHRPGWEADRVRTDPHRHDDRGVGDRPDRVPRHGVPGFDPHMAGLGSSPVPPARAAGDGGHALHARADARQPVPHDGHGRGQDQRIRAGSGPLPEHDARQPARPRPRVRRGPGLHGREPAHGVPADRPPLPVTAAGPDTGPVFLPAAGPWENA